MGQYTPEVRSYRGHITQHMPWPVQTPGVFLLKQVLLNFWRACLEPVPAFVGPTPFALPNIWQAAGSAQLLLGFLLRCKVIAGIGHS